MYIVSRVYLTRDRTTDVQPLACFNDVRDAMDACRRTRPDATETPSLYRQDGDLYCEFRYRNDAGVREALRIDSATRRTDGDNSPLLAK